MRRLAALAAGTVLLAGLPAAHAAVSRSDDTQLESAMSNQGGGSASSPNFRQQVAVGGATEDHQISSARFVILPGFFGAGSVDASVLPVNELDLTVVYAKTSPMGADIPAQTWQEDRDPIFIWEPPITGAEVAGYSYAVNQEPDDVIDTPTTSFNVATATPNALAEGKHTFSVKAINSAGSSGRAVSMELWVDATPPQIVSYTPAPSVLVNTGPAISVNVSDAGSGISPASVGVSVNGSAVSATVDAAAGTITASGVAWSEGVNSIELRVADAVGNEQVPLVWSITVDRQPPSGTLTINAGAALTTSVYVTLGLTAQDATSPITGMLISNDLTSGYVQEPFAASRELWQMIAIRGPQKVYVKFVDKAGNVSAPVMDQIDLALLSPETVITSGPAGFSPQTSAAFTFMCPEGGCLFSYAFDDRAWSDWSDTAAASVSGLAFGNHYFRVKAAKDVNGVEGIQPDEEDPSPAERTWIVGVEPTMLTIPRGPAIKVWRLE